MSLAIIWLITSLLFLIGLAGIVIPGLPGIALVFAGVLFYGWATGFETISVITIVLMALAALAGWLAEYAGGLVGAKAGGGGRAAIIGLLIGMALGLITSGPPGIIVGSVLGALAGAWYAHRAADKAIKVAAFSLLGVIGGKAVQFVLALVIILAFGMALIW